MKRFMSVVTAALTLAWPGWTQQAGINSFPAAMQALTKEVVRHPQPDPNVRRTLALIVASAKRLDEIPPGDARERFRAVLVTQVRKSTTVLNLLGSNSLGEVRAELASNLQQSFGAASLEKAVTRFMGAVANRESRAGAETEIGRTVRAAVLTLRDTGGAEQTAAIIVLMAEAAAVIDCFGADPVALAAIRNDLARPDL